MNLSSGDLSDQRKSAGLWIGHIHTATQHHRLGTHLKIKLVYNVGLSSGGEGWEVGVKSEDRTERLAFHVPRCGHNLPASQSRTATFAALTSIPSRFQTTSDSLYQLAMAHFRSLAYFCPFQADSQGGCCTHALGRWAFQLGMTRAAGQPGQTAGLLQLGDET